jgi:hypothetical protein
MNIYLRRRVQIYKKKKQSLSYAAIADTMRAKEREKRNTDNGHIF